MKSMKKGQGIVALIAMVVLIGLLGWYSFGIVSNTIKGNGKGLKLGLDLAGGVSITYEAQGDKAPSDADMEDTITKLKNRIENDLGSENQTTEANVYRVGDRRITVEIPGVKDANALLEQLGTPGNLYFINPLGADGSENYTLGSDGSYQLAEGKTIESLQEDGSIILQGSDVKSAEGVYETDQTTKAQKPVVQLTFSKKGTEAFGKATTVAAAAQKYTVANTIGIYYDGKFVSVPSVNEPIMNGTCIITGSADIDEAKQLASYIRIGGLDVNLVEIQSQVVSAQLGSNALATSLKAALIGLIIVMLFMIGVYRMPGLAASMALTLYTEVTLAILYLFDITLTLPGIAGIILSIGMAVDANAIIFSRIKEEIGLEHHIAASIEAGFSKALSAIIDGNVTTLIAAAVLGVIGTGTVKGFAITLALGVVLSMFTAIVITKLLVRAFYAIGVRDKKFYGQRVKKPNMNFVGRRAIFFCVSLALVAAGFVGMAVNKANIGKPLNYSLEFLGGTSTTVQVDKDYSLAEIDEQIVPIVAQVTGDNDIQTQKVDQDNSIIIKTKPLSLEQREALNAGLEEKLGITEEAIASENISSVVSGEMRQQSITAVLVAVFFMLIYIWFRFRDFRFASSAIIALAHDVLVTLALYAVVRLNVGTPFIACILTVIGYSVNDTIVIFDRIRENLKGLPENDRNKDSLKEVADRSITETLIRSLSTSFTTAVMVLMLLILGVASIREFALPLLVGVLCGTYSSICIATELWYVMHVRFAKKK